MNMTEPLGMPGQRLPDRLVVEQLASAVIAPCSFRVQAGECLVINGRSGAGKTRLLRLIAELDDAQGAVSLDGIERASMAAPQWRAQVVYQSAEPAWWQRSVLEHIEPAYRPTALLLADRLALAEERLHAAIEQLSTGERQRAALIRSLVRTPKVLLLDEPTSALDPDNTQRVELLLERYRRGGMALLLVTHSREQAARLGGRTIEVQRRTPA